MVKLTLTRELVGLFFSGVQLIVPFYYTICVCVLCEIGFFYSVSTREMCYTQKLNGNTENKSISFTLNDDISIPYSCIVILTVI